MSFQIGILFHITKASRLVDRLLMSKIHWRLTCPASPLAIVERLATQMEETPLAMIVSELDIPHSACQEATCRSQAVRVRPSVLSNVFSA